MRRSIPKFVCVALILLVGGEELFATDVGGLIITDTTWTLAGSPYVVTGSSGIVIGLNATLTIEPGVIVKFNPQLAIIVGSGSWGNGRLIARGTEESPIIFTSVKGPNDVDPAKPGDWSRIHFTDYATDAVFDPDGKYVSGCILEHVIVEYAGYGNYGAVFAEKSSPYLNYCEVRHNAYYGIQVDGTSAPSMKITNCEVWDHPQSGIYISGGAGSNKLINNNIHNNQDGGIYFISASSNILTGNTIMDNTGGGIIFAGGCYGNAGGNTLTGNTITANTGGGIIFSGGCAGNVSGNTLTGNTITANTGGGIIFSGYTGGNAGGNTLTGNTITANTGGGIYFNGCGSYAGGNTLIGNIITDNTSSDGSGIYFNGSGGGAGGNTLTRNVIQRNISGNGVGAVFLYEGSGDTIFSQNVITNNYIVTGTTGGIYVTNSERVSLAGDPNTGTYNIIQGNDGYQVYNNNPFNADGRNDINAVYVRWGTCDMQEVMAGIFDFFDDASKAFVVFYPFVCVMTGDFDSDKDVDWLDLAIFVDNWLRQDCTIPDWCEGTDLNFSTNVDFVDFAYFAEHWLE